MLLGHFHMPPLPQLHSQLFQLASHSRRLRLPLDDKLSTSSCRTVMCEPQEVECLWSSQARPCSLSGSKAPKLDESGLALIERQAEFSQSLPECLQQPSCVAFILGPNDAIIGIAHDHDLAVRMSLAPLVYPSIEGVVQEDVGEDWADPRSLGTPRFDRHPFTALQNAGFQPSPDQTNDPPVGDPVL